MLTDVNLVICFSCKHFAYARFRHLKKKFKKSCPNDLTSRFSYYLKKKKINLAVVSKTLNLFHFINADLFCLNSHRLLFAFQIPQVTPVAFSENVHQQ